MRFSTLSCALIALAAGGGNALAQETNEEGPPLPASTASRDINLVAAGGPSDRALGSAPTPEIQVVASANDKIASLAWTFQFSPAGNGLSYSQFSLRMATAIQDKDGQNELLGLNGFPGGTELELSYTHFFGRTRQPVGPALDNEEAIIRQAAADCSRDERLTDVQRTQRCNLDHADSLSVSDLIWRYNRTRFDEFNRGRFSPVFPFLGLRLSGNQDRFSYLDRIAFSTSKVSRFGYSGTLFGGAVFTQSLTSITASFTYSRRYQAQGSVTLCQAINPTQEQCLTGPDGPPGTARRSVLALELRHAFRPSGSGPARVAIAPELSVDLRDKIYSVNIPIYLARDDRHRLTGGVRFGYINRPAAGGGRDDDFSVGLFVGVPFTLLRRP